MTGHLEFTNPRATRSRPRNPCLLDARETSSSYLSSVTADLRASTVSGDNLSAQWASRMFGKVVEAVGHRAQKIGSVKIPSIIPITQDQNESS